MPFCDPQSLRHRGANENSSELLGQYLPKGTVGTWASKDRGFMANGRLTR